MSSPPKFVLTSSPYQPSRQGDTPVGSNNTGIRQEEEPDARELTIEQQKRAKQICDLDRERFKQFYYDEWRSNRSKQSRSRQEETVQSNKVVRSKQSRSTSNSTGIRQGKDVDAQELTIEEKRAKQICDADKERFRQFYYDELRRKRPKQSGSRGREGVLSNNAAQAQLRARQEQRLRDDQLLEGTRLARQRASREQRVKDVQVLEHYRLDARERSFTDGQIATSDDDLPSFLDKVYQYKKQASADFPEGITSKIQIRCIRDYQRAISDERKHVVWFG